MNQTVNIRAIRSEEQYAEYLKVIDELMDLDPEKNSDAGELLETLAILVEDYEKKQNLELPDTLSPVEAIKIRMTDLGLQQKDLVPAIGDKATVSKILNNKRKLTYEMVSRLSKLLKIPADMLVT